MIQYHTVIQSPKHVPVTAPRRLLTLCPIRVDHHIVLDHYIVLNVESSVVLANSGRTCSFLSSRLTRGRRVRVEIHKLPHSASQPSFPYLNVHINSKHCHTNLCALISIANIHSQAALKMAHQSGSARTAPPRPTTPLRPSSRTSLRSSTSHNPNLASSSSSSMPIDILEPAFAELSDTLSDLESNLLHLQLMHVSLSRFSENFAAFLYGLEMNAFVVDWPEQPMLESLERWKGRQRGEGETTINAGSGIRTGSMRTPTKSALSSTIGGGMGTNEVDSTILSDTTFASLRATPARRRTLTGNKRDEEELKSGTAMRVRRAVREGGGGDGGSGTALKSGIPSRSGSAAGRGARGGRGSALPMRGKGRGVK